MKESRYFYTPDAASVQQLPDEEAAHAVRVLRMHEGDDMMLMDGKGCYYHAEVTMATQKQCLYRVLEVLPQQPQWAGHLHLAIAPTKMMERMEWLAEKAVEVGVDEITFLNCQFSERRVIKLPRIEKIVVSAMKQSRKAWLPQLNDMTDFRTFVSQHRACRKYIAHCYDEVPRTTCSTSCASPVTLPMPWCSLVLRVTFPSTRCSWPCSMAFSQSIWGRAVCAQRQQACQPS